MTKPDDAGLAASPLFDEYNARLVAGFAPMPRYRPTGFAARPGPWAALLRVFLTCPVFLICWVFLICRGLMWQRVEVR